MSSSKFDKLHRIALLVSAFSALAVGILQQVKELLRKDQQVVQTPPE